MLNKTNLARIDLNLLVLFEAVLEERHVGRAAVRMHVSPSAVSHGLGRLRRQRRFEQRVDAGERRKQRAQGGLGHRGPSSPQPGKRRKAACGSPRGAAMIARAGLFHLERGERSGLDLNAFASLPLPGLAD